jgi:hypothetical protein
MAGCHESDVGIVRQNDWAAITRGFKVAVSERGKVVTTAVSTLQPIADDSTNSQSSEDNPFSRLLSHDCAAGPNRIICRCCWRYFAAAVSTSGSSFNTPMP